MEKNKSNQSFINAQKYIAKGLNSPFRSFEFVGGTPVFMEKGKGSKLIDVDGNKYIDYSLGWGPMILGHAPKSIQSTIKKVSKKGWCFGTPTEAETIFAKKITDIFPSMERVRLTNSGTEAVMSAIRLARGYTKKEKIIMFNGNYHGHSNDTLVHVENGNKKTTSEGVPSSILESTLVADYNDINSVTSLLSSRTDIAAILIEPVAANMGLVLPARDFLKELRKVCDEYNCLLIFDEVITGLRVSLGGAQVFYGIVPDITVLGKALAGGLPIGAFGARSEIMDILSPQGSVYTAGTFSGNPMTTNCGISTLHELSHMVAFKKLSEKTQELCEDLQLFIKENSLPAVINYVGSIFSIFFTEQNEVRSLDDVKKSDPSVFAEYFQFLLSHGIYISPSNEDVCFLSTAHTKNDIKYTKAIIKNFLISLKK